MVPMAYSRKFGGLFGTLGYDMLADLRTETTERALKPASPVPCKKPGREDAHDRRT